MPQTQAAILHITASLLYNMAERYNYLTEAGTGAGAGAGAETGLPAGINTSTDAVAEVLEVCQSSRIRAAWGITDRADDCHTFVQVVSGRTETSNAVTPCMTILETAGARALAPDKGCVSRISCPSAD